MDISSAGQQRISANRNAPGSSPSPTVGRVENVRSVADSESDRGNGVALDSATFSQLGLNLSKTSSVSGLSNQRQIQNGREALEAANNAKTAIQNSPTSGQRAYSSVSASVVQGLLA
jgi:hypothetical protein